MRILVQKRASGLYFLSLGSWSTNPKEAYVFMTAQSAVRFCQYHGIVNVSIVAQSNAGDYRVIRTVPATLSHR